MESSANTLSEALLSAFIKIIDGLVNLIPELLIALLILGVGLALAQWLRSLVISGVRALNLSKILGSTAIGKFLTTANIELKVETILGEIVRFFVIYLFTISALNKVGLTSVADIMMSLLGYVPTLISALFILLVGVLAAGFIEQLVKSIIAPIDVSTARLAGKASSYAVVITALIIAIGELGIAKDYILIMFAGFIFMVTLSVGLALGLGSKELVSQILTGWYQKVTAASKPKPKKAK